jgi:hypothetical protein
MGDFVVLPGANNKTLGVLASWRFNNKTSVPSVLFVFFVVQSPTPNT